MSQLQLQPTDDDTFYIMLPDNILSAADVEAQLATEAAERAEQLQLETRLKSIASIPWEHCPWPAVRNELMGRILSGAPITAYSGLIFDGTYAGLVRCSPHEWAIRNGYLSADDDGKEAH